MAEWLRRLIRNHMGFARTGSTPVVDVTIFFPFIFLFFLFLTQREYRIIIVFDPQFRRSRSETINSSTGDRRFHVKLRFLITLF